MAEEDGGGEVTVGDLLHLVESLGVKGNEGVCLGLYVPMAIVGIGIGRERAPGSRIPDWWLVVCMILLVLMLTLTLAAIIWHAQATYVIWKRGLWYRFPTGLALHVMLVPAMFWLTFDAIRSLIADIAYRRRYGK